MELPNKETFHSRENRPTLPISGSEPSVSSTSQKIASAPRRQSAVRHQQLSDEEAADGRSTRKDDGCNRPVCRGAFHLRTAGDIVLPGMGMSMGRGLMRWDCVKDETT
jgi:hypothetical protein